jgi:hypothetical protein
MPPVEYEKLLDEALAQDIGVSHLAKAFMYRSRGVTG